MLPGSLSSSTTILSPALGGGPPSDVMYCALAAAVRADDDRLKSMG